MSFSALGLTQHVYDLYIFCVGRRFVYIIIIITFIIIANRIQISNEGINPSVLFTAMRKILVHLYYSAFIGKLVKKNKNI